MTKKKKKKNAFSKWLEKLQQESWQLELLISSLVIYALLESLKVIDKAYLPLEEITSNTDVLGFVLGMALIILHSSIYIFLINLIIHVLIRSLWIAAIGLRYVSGNINYDQLNYSEHFTNYYRRQIGSFDSYIEKLENFASILFSYTFLLFFILLSFYFYFLGTILFMSLARAIVPENLEGIVFFLLLINLALGLFVAFDFLTLGIYKKVKNKHFSRFYLTIYRFYSFITLSFLWRPMLLNFLDQTYTRRLFLMIIPYLIFLATVFGFNFIGYGHYPNFHNQASLEIPDLVNQHSFNFSFYEDERNQYEDIDKRRIRNISIPSKRIKGLIGEVFVKAESGDKWLITKMDSTLHPLRGEGLIHSEWNDFKAGFEKGGTSVDEEEKLSSLDQEYKGRPNYHQKRDSLLKTFEGEEEIAKKQDFLKAKSILEKAILISINDHPIASDFITCDYYNHYHGKTVGMLCYFPLDSLKNGRHYLTVQKVTGKNNKRTKIINFDTLVHTIPFIYENY